MRLFVLTLVLLLCAAGAQPYARPQADLPTFHLDMKPDARKRDPHYHEKRPERLRLSAERGDAEAQYSLGVLYITGDGVAQDYAEALKWYRLSADQGDAYAQYALGFMYAEGRGVPRDDGEAVKWCRLGVAQSYADAQYALGEMYEEGRGASQDRVKAYKWFFLAEKAGYKQAKEKLLLLAEHLTPKQIKEAEGMAHKLLAFE